MQTYEKLGVFYLGKEYDLESKQPKEELVLLKSKDLTTHAVIIGMTGSGKTGLGIGLIEEAIIDNIPVIAIDPKGDLGNLALTFPRLRGEDFRPWINLQEASNKGVSPDEYAEAQAELWRKGLSDWGQDGSRIEKLRNEADVKIYTPGGSAGIGVSVLKSFNAPPQVIIDDKESYRDRISVTTISLLSLIGIQADPFKSREFILISNILDYNWSSGKNLSLPELINAIQKPPMDKVGVMDMERFYPSKDRISLAMMLNNLLASPGFEAWIEGESLDVNRFLYDHVGKPQVSIFSIAHLSESERMFFVTMLLNEVLSWVRSQPGTGSLRAILYMDELFGYLPPTANPPSKGPLLTLLKQARAYGLGLVLSTQNPVDLDYKALSNAGTWFIGRLQTERDKERVLAGLEGAAAGGKFDKARTEQILAGIGQRVFYLHSVHEDEPVIFNTRWVMSYLAGPLTRNQIAALPSINVTSSERSVTSESVTANTTPISSSVIQETTHENEMSSAAPILPPQIKQVYLPVKFGAGGKITYRPSVIGMADVLYSNTKHKVSTSISYTLLTPLHDGPVALDWSEAETLDIGIHDLDSNPLEGLSFEGYPVAATNAKNYDSWKRLLTQYIRTQKSLKLLSCPGLKVVSEFGEDERDFRIRLQHLVHEKRDEDLEAMKKKYASKIQTLTNRKQRAEQAVEKQSSRASQRKMDAAVSAGSAILGALFGRKSISATSVSKIGTAVKSTSRALKSGEGIEQAKELLESIEVQLDELNLELEQQLVEISNRYDVMKEELEEVEIRAISENIAVHLVGLAWVPHEK
ncbi:MAG: DUF87 domain-containing protein [Clostridia bacterium]|nr:DUF87 domain-containing protein [Clostridia bacterium]